MELQIRMLFISNENVQNHMYTSSPWDWLLLTRGIAYWVASDSNVSAPTTTTATTIATC